jgi:hypothetical protein
VYDVRSIQKGKLQEDTRGVVLLEFIIVFVPVFILFLGIVQLALLWAASLVVQHAAVAGVRSAVVVLDDDPRFYGGVKRGIIGGKSDGSTSQKEQAFADRLGLTDTNDEGPPSLGGPRMAAITRAVHTPLAAIAPEPSLAAGVFRSRPISVRDAIGAAPASRLLAGLSTYLPLATAVTFPRNPGSEQLFDKKVDAKDGVTVRVTHLVMCTVPIVAGLICDRLVWNPKAKRLSLGRNSKDPKERAFAELKKAPDANRQASLIPLGTPALVLQAEATLPSQATLYPYEGEKP